MNIFELLTYDIKEHNRILTIHQDTEWPPFWRSFIRRYHRLLRWVNLQQLLYYLSHSFYKLCEPLKPLLFVTISNNNDRALQPMMSRLGTDSYSIIDQRDMNRYVPTVLVLFYSIVFVWPFLRCYLSANKHEKSLMAEYFDEYFSTIGYIVIMEKLLRHNKVKLIVLANDHVSFTRAVVRIAGKLGIKTMYTQHCSVTSIFPPLEFTYSFLDGEESLLKYMVQKKPYGMVYLSGNSRFDLVSKYKALHSSYAKPEEDSLCIGIASNQLDDEELIKYLCMDLQSRGYRKLIMRPHPAQTVDNSWFVQNDIGFSESQKENPFEFLSRVDVVIAGETGLHLDAAMMGVRSICYNTINAAPLDWYSYIKNGLIPYASNIDELISILSSENCLWRRSHQQKARWYNAAFGTKLEGHIGEMLTDFIRYEQVGDIDGFDKKYGFVEKVIDETIVKVYGD